ncbi:ATPase [Aureibaculum sp. 2210JD6-5]|uniref:ATPase n=1 Tax=Aureibaculum sp. 2210JD6-5 TaxID=3103957 RepID=UPI002AADA677|nr:ATPase [Aureibaculum sp. 2210JD6-5]MDY7396741.1 ATPase [Aureibaculum sp. 2210JD6-5]
MESLYKIKEQGREYILGEIKDDTIYYDLVKTLTYLDVKGKLLFGAHFKIYEKDFKIIYKLLIYIIRDKANCKKHNLNLNKGILLTGPIGCGKTSLMSLIRHIVPKKRQYQMQSARNISFEYQKIGHQVIESYNKTKSFCFDDLGIEQNLKHYGNDCNVMGEILLSRYDFWISHKAITHATTNLNAQELEEWYGNRVRSRMRQMFNLISFDAKSVDKRS